MTSITSRIVKTVVALTCALGMAIQPVLAHDTQLHAGLAQTAYEKMKVMRRMNAPGNQPGIGAPPAGITPAQWKAFFNAATNSYNKLNAQNGTDPDAIGNPLRIALGEAAPIPDKNIDDTHLHVKPGNALGLGVTKEYIDKVTQTGALILLVPIVCACSCILSLFGVGDDLCSECIDNAKDLSKEVPEPLDITNLIGGIGDVTDSDYVGVWHFINLNSGLDNEYDDHQGMLYTAAGPNGRKGAIDWAIIVATDATGLSVWGAKSDGVQHYQIAKPGDAFSEPDMYEGSKLRDNGDWDEYAMGHIPFSPVDNLALYGWRQYRSTGKVSMLGYPMHAIGDATVPMHVAGTTSWGHRPFEEAYNNLWVNNEIKLDEARVLGQAARYYNEIVAWRAQGHPGDVPVRHLVRSVARHTIQYSMTKWAETKSSKDPWPFFDAMSAAFYFGNDAGEKWSTARYQNRDKAAELVQPLLEDGAAATLALLVAAGDAEPLGSKAQFLVAPTTTQAATATPALRASGTVPILRRLPPIATADPAYAVAIRNDYAALASLFVTGKLTLDQYAFRLRDRDRKAAMFRRDPALVAAFAKGDADGDRVPDDRDASPGTPRFAATDDRGRAVADPVPPRGGATETDGVNERELRANLSTLRAMVSPECEGQDQPDVPTPQQFTRTNGLALTVSRSSVITTRCPVFYEMSVRITNPAGAGVVVDEREVVFRSNEAIGSAASSQTFVIPANAPNPSPSRDYLVHKVLPYQLFEWKVRAVNANGVRSAWSAYKRVTG